jgi:DNA-binding transcriptional LysR family regulator
MAVHAQLEALAEKRIDLGFLRLPARTEGLVFRTVSREALLLALPSSHRLAQSPVLGLSSLAGEPFILYPDHPRPSWAEFIVGLCQQAGFRPTIAQRTVEIQTTLSLVAAGMGVSIVPACVSNIPRKDVVYRRLSGVRARTQLLAAYRAEDTSPVLRSFLKLMWQMLRVDRARAKERIREPIGHTGGEHGRSPSAA